jgi:hypothetical protein
MIDDTVGDPDYIFKENLGDDAEHPVIISSSEEGEEGEEGEDEDENMGRIWGDDTPGTWVRQVGHSNLTKTLELLRADPKVTKDDLSELDSWFARLNNEVANWVDNVVTAIVGHADLFNEIKKMDDEVTQPVRLLSERHEAEKDELLTEIEEYLEAFFEDQKHIMAKLTKNVNGRRRYVKGIHIKKGGI